MSYGLLWDNLNGERVIDSSYRNQRAYETTSFSLSDSGTTRLAHQARPDRPLCFAHDPNDLVAFAYETDAYDATYVYSAANQTVTFGWGDVTGGLADSTKWGMRIWDANGAPVLDSRERMLVVADVVTFNPSVMSVTSIYQFSHASVSQPYYLISSLGGVAIAYQPEVDLRYVYYPGVRGAGPGKMEVGFVLGQILGAGANNDIDGRPSVLRVIVAEFR